MFHVQKCAQLSTTKQWSEAMTRRGVGRTGRERTGHQVAVSRATVAARQRNTTQARSPGSAPHWLGPIAVVIAVAVYSTPRITSHSTRNGWQTFFSGGLFSEPYRDNATLTIYVTLRRFSLLGEKSSSQRAWKILPGILLQLSYDSL